MSPRVALSSHVPAVGEKLSRASCAVFLAKSYVAFKFPPKNRTFPLMSFSSNVFPSLWVNKQWTLMDVAPATVVTSRSRSLPSSYCRPKGHQIGGIFGFAIALPVNV